MKKLLIMLMVVALFNSCSTIGNRTKVEVINKSCQRTTEECMVNTASVITFTTVYTALDVAWILTMQNQNYPSKWMPLFLLEK
jgi:uncharacterized protein YceK